MENYPTWMPVVAAALSRGDGRWLMQRRRAETHHGGLWEFPGGKVEPSETPRAALVRELEEELELVLTRDRLHSCTFADGAEAADGTPIVIILYTAMLEPAEVAAIPDQGAGGDIEWFTACEALSQPRPPLDIILGNTLFGSIAE